MKQFILTAIITLIASMAFSQKAQTSSFKVFAVCGMCEERIEKALDTKGVKIADFDVETGICTVTYNPKKIIELDLHQLVAGVGHDTEKIKATDEAYQALHSCCKYREGGKSCGNGDNDNHHNE
jgi:copper chaperone CopZ